MGGRSGIQPGAQGGRFRSIHFRDERGVFSRRKQKLSDGLAGDQLHPSGKVDGSGDLDDRSARHQDHVVAVEQRGILGRVARTQRPDQIVPCRILAAANDEDPTETGDQVLGRLPDGIPDLHPLQMLADVHIRLGENLGKRCSRSDFERTRRGDATRDPHQGRHDLHHLQVDERNLGPPVEHGLHAVPHRAQGNTRRVDPAHVGNDQISTGVHHEILIAAADAPPAQPELVPDGQLEYGIDDRIGWKVLLAQEGPRRLLRQSSCRTTGFQSRCHLGRLRSGGSKQEEEREKGDALHGFQPR